MKKAAKKKPNKQDSTMRNINSLKKRVKALERGIESHNGALINLLLMVEGLQKKHLKGN